MLLETRGKAGEWLPLWQSRSCNISDSRQSRDEYQDALMPSIFLDQGKYEMRMGYYETAVTSFTKVIEDDHDAEMAYVLRSQCHCK